MSDGDQDSIREQTARSHYDQALAFRRADRWQEAERAFVEAVRLIAGSQMAVAERRLLAAALSGLADTYTQRGDPRQALRSLLAAHRLLRRTLGPRAPELGRILNDRGVVWKSLGRLGLARHLYDRAAAVLDEDTAASAEDRATLLHNLGGIEFARGNFEQAEVFARQGLSLRHACADRDGLAVASDSAALAAILREHGNLDEAEALYRAALDAFSAALDGQDHEVALCQEGLALVLAARGDHLAGRDLLERAVVSRARQLGPDHPDLGILLANLGVLTAKCGDRETARRHLTAARDILVVRLGADHALTRACLAALGKVGAG